MRRLVLGLIPGRRHRIKSLSFFLDLDHLFLPYAYFEFIMLVVVMLYYLLHVVCTHICLLVLIAVEIFRLFQ